MRPADRFCRSATTSRKSGKSVANRILAGFPLGHQGFEVSLQFRQPALEVSAKSHQLAGFPDAVDRLVKNVEVRVHAALNPEGTYGFRRPVAISRRTSDFALPRQ